MSTLPTDTADLALGRAIREIWTDQAAFNRLFRQPPSSAQELAEQVRSFVLYTESELHELLRTTRWKEHRKLALQPNRPHMIEEGVDVFKCVLSILQILGMTPEELILEYWQKTRVVRQRYQEEWASRVEAPCAVVDIDNVLADYITGLCDWILCTPAWRRAVDMDAVHEILATRRWINADALDITQEQWKRLKHDFRTSGGKRTLPVFPEARGFLERCRAEELQIVLLTSRPIDRYPNLYTDTLNWLIANHLPFDFIWWSHDKAERVLEGNLREHVRFAVDDDLAYVRQLSALGIPTYWRTHATFVSAIHPADLPTNVRPVTSLAEILPHYLAQGARTCQTTPTPSTDPMPSTEAKTLGSSMDWDPTTSTSN